MTEEKKRFTLRIDNKLFEKLENSAKNNKRSITKEIEFIIEQAINTDKK